MAARKRLPRSPLEKDPNRPLIERALAMGVPLTQVAKRYGHSLGAVHRFRERMPQQLKAAIIGATLRPGIDDLDKLRSDEAAGLLGNLAHQRARLLLTQDVAMEEGAGELVARLSGVIHKNLAMVGRYLGLFANLNVNTNVNVLISEDYLRLRQALVLALRPYPEARRAVADAMHRVEGEVAQRMLAQAGKASQSEPLGESRPPSGGGFLAAAGPGSCPQSAIIDQPPSDTRPPVPLIKRPSESLLGHAGR